VLEVGPVAGEPCLAVKVPADLGADLVRIVERVRWMFDLDAEPREIAAHLRRDPALRERVRTRPGLRIPGAWDGFELAVRAVLGQQITVAGATTLTGRLVEAHGDPHPNGEDGLHRLFPRPRALLRADLSRLGLTKSRAETLRALARAVCRGELVLDGSAEPDEVREQLRSLPGIGDWTAQYVAMRALGESDAFPAGDLGLRRALADGSNLPTSRRVLERAEAWRPWRAYAAMHLWTEG
jgi:AraC family transcriptional regulator of adaptative response / DNA-3-methyladenine glycosylase II